MKLSVDHLAKLSKLNVSTLESKALFSQFQTTLNVVSELNQLDTQKVIATPQVTGFKNRFRPDVIDSSRILSQADALSNAAYTHRGYFLVPGILEGKS